MIFGYLNKYDAATKTYSREENSLPGENTEIQHLSQRWRVSGSSDFHVLIDMGEPVTCGALAVLGTNLSSSATVQVLAASADASVSAVDFSGGVITGVNPSYANFYDIFPSQQTYRYWRVNISDPNASPSYREVGRIFLGPVFEIINPSMGASWGWVDPSQTARSRGGQSFTDVLTKYRVVDFSIVNLDEDTAFSTLFEMDRVAGNSGDVFAFFGSTRSDERTIWGQMERLAPLFVNQPNAATKRYRISERK